MPSEKRLKGMKGSRKIILTEAQAELIEWACVAGLEQHEKFLRHDDWDAGLSKDEAHKEQWADRRFLKAIKAIRKARA